MSPTTSTISCTTSSPAGSPSTTGQIIESNMSEISKDQFLNEYSRALEDGNAALFAGAGTSAASGMVDWRGLLRGIAKGLGVDVDEESDLIGLAQYEHNSAGTRHRLNSAIIDEFNKRATFSQIHKWLAQLPIETVWTT